MPGKKMLGKKMLGVTQKGLGRHCAPRPTARHAHMTSAPSMASTYDALPRPAPAPVMSSTLPRRGSRLARSSSPITTRTVAARSAPSSAAARDERGSAFDGSPPAPSVEPSDAICWSVVVVVVLHTRDTPSLCVVRRECPRPPLCRCRCRARGKMRARPPSAPNSSTFSKAAPPKKRSPAAAPK